MSGLPVVAQTTLPLIFAMRAAARPDDLNEGLRLIGAVHFSFRGPS